MLSKLKYAGMKTEDLIDIYIPHKRSVTEYCSTAFHSSLTVEQDKKLEAIQKISLKVILGDMYISYEASCEMAGLKTLDSRRSERSLSYGLKAVKHPENKQKFPHKQVESLHTLRAREKYHVNFARTEAYKRSAVPTIQSMLNAHAERGASGVEGSGEEPLEGWRGEV